MRQFAAPLVIAAALAACTTYDQGAPPATHPHESRQTMQLGAFSISLAVKDLEASRAFYEKLDFEVVGGDAAQNWLILRSGTSTVGLFQGMFPNNIMTFNPGWNAAAEPLADFDDVRTIQQTLEERGIEIQTRADEASTGPASCVIADPDGNTILLDQHVPRPGN